MGRRSLYLTLALVIPIVCAFIPQKGVVGDDQGNSFGWASGVSTSGIERLLDSIPHSWVDSGSGQVRLLCKEYESVHGFPYQPRRQGSLPTCVGQCTAAGVDILAAVQIHSGKNERAPPAPFSASVIYSLSRHEIGGKDNNWGGGSHCVWAAQAINRFGVVPMLDYPQYGLDLTNPSVSTQLSVDRNGVPNGLKTLGQHHVVVEFIQINSYEEARDAIYNGCPVIVGSNVGYGRKSGQVRDKEGFLSRPRGWFAHGKVWKHGIVLVGMADLGREGCLVLNSWGDEWVDGPKRFPSDPDGSFWADARNIQRMVSQGDSFALKFYQGYVSYEGMFQ